MAYLTTNPSLKIIKPGWKENPLGKDGKYINLDGPSEKSFADLLKWQLSKNPYSRAKKYQKTNVDTYTNELFLHTFREGITWLGHASFFFQLDGYRIIVDPVFYDVGPVKRFTPFPCLPEDILAIDYILISHNHRDHLDEKSLRLLCENNPKAIILTGLQIGALIKEWDIKNEIIEAGWYQQYFSEKFLSISYLPAKHWNRRYLRDLNTMLWGSFIFKTPNITIYYGADSGLGIHFDEIAALFPEIDIAIIGIGAYEPIWFMHPSHTSPADAINVGRQLKVNHLIPMHYGTFDLGNEPIFYPKSQILRLSKDVLPFHVHCLDIGKFYALNSNFK